MFTRMIFGVLLTIFATGCATQQAPHAMQRPDVPLSETAVFAAFDGKPALHNDVRIQAVNGQEIACDAWAGCPWWVRVEPGKYTFTIRYVSGAYYGTYESGYKAALVKVEVPAMVARHVYTVSYLERGGQVGYEVKDLGENPDFNAGPGYPPVKF